jgi:uncharacterized protein (DUF433 family)
MPFDVALLLGVEVAARLAPDFQADGAMPAVAYDRIVSFDRITTDAHVMGGVPCIRGTRIPVATVVGMVAEGMMADEIVADYPQLSVEDVQDALRYAAAAVDERELPLRPAG